MYMGNINGKVLLLSQYGAYIHTVSFKLYF